MFNIISIISWRSIDWWKKTELTINKDVDIKCTAHDMFVE